MNKRLFKGTVKCAYCGTELTCDDIKDYNAGYPDYEYLVEKGMVSYEEQLKNKLHKELKYE